MSVAYAEEARADLASAITYLVERSPAAAESFYVRLSEVVVQLDARSFEGPEERLTTGELVRSWPVYPFRVYYQRREDMLFVLRVYHQARAPIAKRAARRRRAAKKR